MNILHVHTKLNTGGIESFLVDLLNELVKFHSVTLCLIFEPSNDDICLKKLDKNIEIISLHKNSPGFKVIYVLKLFWYVLHSKFDCVNFHSCFYYSFFTIFLLSRKTKFFYTIHSDASKENNHWDNKLFRIKKLFFQKGLMKAITISQESKRSFSLLYKTSSTLIYNGIALEKKIAPNYSFINKYKINSSTKVFFHPARICEAKNQLMLCETFESLIHQNYDVILIIAGQNQDIEIYNELSKYFSDRIIYIGQRNDILSLLAASDAFCLSSIWEGMPISLLEAMSVSCIPICTPVGGIKNVLINSFNGFMSKEVSAVAYTKSIKEFLSISKNELAIMKDNVYQTSQKYNIELTARLYTELYIKNN